MSKLVFLFADREARRMAPAYSAWYTSKEHVKLYAAVINFITFN